MKIINVINNNTVSVIDDKGKEQIISGKGIGFGKKYGDEPDKDKIQKISAPEHITAYFSTLLLQKVGITCFHAFQQISQ